MNSNFSERGGYLLVAISLGAAAFAFFTYFNNPNMGSADAKDSADVSNSKSVFKPMLKPLVFEPKSMTITSIGLVDASIINVGVASDGSLETPTNWQEIGWYVNGPKAGEDGNAILAGHYDSNTGAPAVFFKLDQVEVGDIVSIKDSMGKELSFEVYSSEHVDVSDPTAVTKAYEVTKEPILTLITCGGVWDPVAQNYTKRLLLKAKRLDIKS